MILSPSSVELAGTVLFVLALVHTFLTSRFLHLGSLHPEGSIGENFFHLLGEIEIVFGLWAGILILVMIGLEGGAAKAIGYVEALDFKEPLFVFVIMAVAATRPVLRFCEVLILRLPRLVPGLGEIGCYFSCLFLGPLLGSLITEPAAMTVTALILRERYLSRETSLRFRYGTLAVLFVNVSIGGVLTPFAAPPVLMVAGPWGWGLQFMLANFGWKAALACGINAAGAAWLFRRELRAGGESSVRRPEVPGLLVAIHLAFLLLIVLTAHHPVIFVGLFLFFLGVAAITREYQDELKIRESLLVGFFLGGLVVLGGLQRWWLAPVLERLSELSLFLGTAALTAFTDNAALTYLGAQVPGVSDGFKFALVGGAVAGGGLTVIANAPNPAGYSILKDRFGPDGISPLALARAALVPTLVAMACLWLLP